MTLKRTSIRAYVRTQLLAVPQTDAAANVFDFKVKPVIAADELPFINILTLEEEMDDASSGFSQYHETKRGKVEIWASIAPATAENAGVQIDTITEQIMDKFRTDRSLGGNVTDFEYESTSINVQPHPETPVIVAVLTYNVRFLEE